MLNEEGLKVRPPRELIWNEYHDEQGIPDRWDAETPFNTYYGIALLHDGYSVQHDYVTVAANLQSLDEAKAAAAADCVTRCTAYLSTVEKPESDAVRDPGFDWTVSQETEQAMRAIDESIRAAHIQASTTFVGASDKPAAEKPEGGWRSMDSAPKGDGKRDGPTILVHGGSIEFDASDNRFPSTEVERVNWSLSESCWIAGYYGGHDMFIRVIDPLGWQPLPTPPASALKGGE